MPQFDIVVYSNELIWVFFFFLLIYSLNYLFFFPRISEIFKTREKKIEKDIVLLDKVNKRLNILYNKKEEYIINKFLMTSFTNFVSFCTFVGLLYNITSLNFNLKLKYYLTCYYNYFDFFELD